MRYYRCVHERHRSVGEQHQPNITEPGGREGSSRVRPRRRIRSVPSVSPVRFVPVATASARVVAGCVRFRNGRRAGSQRHVRRPFAPRTGCEQEFAVARDQRSASTLQCLVAQRFDAQTLRR